MRVLSRCCVVERSAEFFRAARGRGLNWTDLSGHHIKLIGKRHRLRVACELALANCVHELDAGENGTSSMERFEVQHRFGHTLDSTMFLLEYIGDLELRQTIQAFWSWKLKACS